MSEERKPFKKGQRVISVATAQNHQSLIRNSVWNDIGNPLLNTRMQRVFGKTGTVIYGNELGGYVSVRWDDDTSCGDNWDWHPAWLSLKKSAVEKYKFILGKEE